MRYTQFRNRNRSRGQKGRRNASFGGEIRIRRPALTARPGRGRRARTTASGRGPRRSKPAYPWPRAALRTRPAASSPTPRARHPAAGLPFFGFLICDSAGHWLGIGLWNLKGVEQPGALSHSYCIPQRGYEVKRTTAGMGMGMGAPDVRCGAKLCPDSHSCAGVGFFLVKSFNGFLGGGQLGWNLQSRRPKKQLNMTRC